MANAIVHFEIPADDVERAPAWWTQTGRSPTPLRATASRSSSAASSGTRASGKEFRDYAPLRFRPARIDFLWLHAQKTKI
jgi:hypothetical protein